MRTFILTPTHVALVRRMNVDWDDGSPVIDNKRPYGNSDIVRDIAEIAGDPTKPSEWGDYPQEFADRMWRLHRETATALQVVLATGSFEPGEYVADDYRNNWRRCSVRVYREDVPPGGVNGDDGKDRGNPFCAANEQP